MRPRFRPSLEKLESQTLPSGLVASVPVAPAPATPGSVALALTTDRTDYRVGQPVAMTLTETNTSTHHVRIADGPSADGFSVTQNGAAIWRSNAGPQPLFLRLVDLAPGQSYTVKATWDGHPSRPGFFGGELPTTPTGTFVVHSQVVQAGATAKPVTITIQPPTTPAPTPKPTQPLTLTVTTDHASYRVGQPVTVTLTETNTSNHDVPALFGARILSATMSGPGGNVWQYRDLRASPTLFGVLHAGQTRTLTLTWNGTPDLPAAKVVPGAYTVRAGVDGVSGTAAFVLNKA